MTEARRRCLNRQRHGPPRSLPGEDDRVHPVNPGPGRHPGGGCSLPPTGAAQIYARTLAVEFLDRNIRCNAVCPGFIETPHGLREVADLQALGVDVSEAAIAQGLI